MKRIAKFFFIPVMAIGLAGCGFLGEGDEFRVIGAGHVRETGAEFLEIRSDERVREAVDMVLDDHDIPDVQVVIDAASRVGDEEIADAEYLHDTDREGDQIHRVSLVIMEPALHGDDFLAGEGSENEVPLMPDRRADRESRNILVGDDGLSGNLVRQTTQAAPEHDSNFRAFFAQLGADEIRRIVNPFQSFFHN